MDASFGVIPTGHGKVLLPQDGTAIFRAVSAEVRGFILYLVDVA